MPPIMPNVNPLQIMVGVGGIFVAPPDTTFPTPDQTPAQASAAWVNLGQTDGGITVSPAQTLNQWYVDQETGPVKTTRSQERLALKTNLAIFTLENLARVMNGQTVTVNAPNTNVRGFRQMPFYQGLKVTEYSFIFEGDSPYLANDKLRYLVPRAYVMSANFDMVFKKDGMTFIPVEFDALVDYVYAGGKFGVVQAVDQPGL
jgi:hypothetical protein